MNARLREVRSSLVMHLHTTLNTSPRYIVLAALHHARHRGRPPTLASLLQMPAFALLGWVRRRALAKLVLSEHPYAVQSMRERGMPRSWRVCRFCQRREDVEDEEHVLFRCKAPALQELRLRMIARMSTRAANAEGLFLTMRDRPWAYVDFLGDRPELLGMFADLVLATYSLCADTPAVSISSEDALRDLAPLY